MGRANFGSSQDLSQLFGSLYNQYADRLETLANRAAADAEKEQAAADNDFIDRWQQGEVADAEFLAYVTQRVAESADDPEALTQWKKIQRDAEKSIKSEQISDTAEDIINDINAGTKTYADLLNFYKSQQKGLRPSDPLYDELSKQIDQVNDRIAENRIAGAISGIDYRFRSGSLTGRQAGAELRAQAERYRVNDPAKYYQLLSNALEYEQYGGVYSAGGSGGSGGGGGGGGSSSATLNGTIDALQGIEKRMMSLSEQFEAGETVGSITYQDASGALVTENLQLRDADGTPTRDMQAVDDALLENFDALEAAYIEKGDLSAAGETNNRRMGLITNHIQPRNTISKENQANALLAGFQSAVEAAANSTDPVLAWSKVQAAGRSIERWYRSVNTVSTIGQRKPVDDMKARENPELMAANRTETFSPAAIEDRTTAEFQGTADALLNTVRTVISAKNVDGLAAAGDSLVLMLGETGASAFMERVAAAVDLVTGIPEGRYTRVFVPGEGLVFTPLGDTVETRRVLDPATGEYSMKAVPVQKPVDVEGNALANEANGERMDTILMEINGRMEEVGVISGQSYFVGGQQVTQSDFEQAQRQLQTLQESEKRTAADEEQLSLLQSSLGSYRQALAPRADGKPGAVTWFQDQAGLWYKNKVTKGGGLPFIFTGRDARKAQQVANTQINPATGQVWDPTGRAYFNERDFTQKQSHNVLSGDGDDWYDRTSQRKQQEARQADRAAVTGSVRFGRSPLEDGKVGQIIQKQASQLGINLGAPASRKTMPRLADPGSVGAVTIRRPNVNVSGAGASFDASSLRARLASLVAGRRQSLANRNTSIGPETYAGSDFSGFQE